ncbi:MAG: ABC transporter substrate-binding protein [Rhodospirillaceae bacterium]|nr:ABC transporter substrate-binding protein [Rhodospirillaceae bacterium]
MIGRNSVAALAVAAVGSMGAAQAGAAEKVDFILNWIAGGDHAPYYYAKKMGLYAKAGIDLNIQQGKGSSMSSRRTGAGKNPIGLADLGTALVTMGKGARMVAVMNVYANSPYGMYWLNSSGIKGPKDFAGKKIGNPPWDAARQMWPALAKKVGVDPATVKWVNIQPNAKLAALKAGSIDVTTSFYNIHHIFKRVLGKDMGFFPWSKYGINPYGNSIIVNMDYLKKNKKTVAAFVSVTQKAFQTCVKTPAPCIAALVEANKGLKTANETENWGLVTELMSDKFSRTVALGYFDPARMKSDHELVNTYFKIETKYPIEERYTNEFLDRDIKMPKIDRKSAFD